MVFGCCILKQSSDFTGDCFSARTSAVDPHILTFDAFFLRHTGLGFSLGVLQMVSGSPRGRRSPALGLGGCTDRLDAQQSRAQSGRIPEGTFVPENS